MEKCSEWKGAINSGGYPVTWHNNKIAYVHRVIMNAQPGQIVMHTCDNPKCINPNHLKIGTHKENSQDMVNKNRQVKGSKSHLAKLNEDIVRLIKICKGSMSSRQCAGRFGISKTNVLDIWRGKIWKHVVV